MRLSNSWVKKNTTFVSSDAALTLRRNRAAFAKGALSHLTSRDIVFFFFFLLNTWHCFAQSPLVLSLLKSPSLRIFIFFTSLRETSLGEQVAGGGKKENFKCFAFCSLSCEARVVEVLMSDKLFSLPGEGTWARSV